jgi:hypothetical protein
MIDDAIRPTLAKALAAAALLGAAWTFAVRPARASLDDRRMMLAAQADAVAAFEGVMAEPGRSGGTLGRLESEARAFSRDLSRHASTASLFQQLELLAAQRQVRVLRTDPRGSVTLEAGQSEPEGGPTLAAESFFIEFSGAFGDVTGLVHDLQTGLGVARIREFRLAPAGEGLVHGTLMFTVYRAPPGAKIVPEAAEPEDDEA